MQGHLWLHRGSKQTLVMEDLGSGGRGGCRIEESEEKERKTKIKKGERIHQEGLALGQRLVERVRGGRGVEHPRHPRKIRVCDGEGCRDKSVAD